MKYTKYMVAALICAGFVVGMVFYFYLPASSEPATVLSTDSATKNGRNVVADTIPAVQVDVVPQPVLPTNGDKPDSVQPYDDRMLDFLFERLSPDYVPIDVRRRKELDDSLRSIFGYIPANPVAELSKLSADRLAAMLRRRDELLLFGLADYSYSSIESRNIGSLLGDLYTTDELLGWFEHAGVKPGVEGEVAAKLLRQVVSKKYNELRNSSAQGRRILALFESYLEVSKENPTSSGASSAIWIAFGDLCPIEGGLDLIRRWTVETPHGDESTETALVEFLKKWPLAEATPLILDVLETRRAGAIKGIVSAWSSTKKESGTSEWSITGAKQLLESPLTEAVKTTKSSTAVLYAAIFAAEDLLRPRAQEIADALLARRDNAYVSSQGFSFLEVVDKYTANAAWSAWLESNNQYKMLAACMSAGNFRGVSAKPQALNRMFELASKPQERDDLQGAAGLALCQVDSDYSRSLDILYIWLNNLPIADPTLVAAGRLVVWGPEAEVKTMLLAEIDDPNKEADERHYAMFLLAILDPNSALAICEDRKDTGKLTEFTILLVAATAEGMNSDYYWSRAAALREACSETEPQWMKNIRLKLDSKEYRAEENIVGYARSRPK